MLNLGITAAERTALYAQKVRPHRVRTRIEVWSLDHEVLADLSEMFDSGQSNDDTAADAVSSATCALFDPLFLSGFDSATDLGAFVPPKYMIHAVRDTFVDSLGRWIAEPVFTGPVLPSNSRREGDLLTLGCQSKEWLASRNVWRPIVVKKGTNKATAIRKILAACGETFFNLASTTAKLSADINIGGDKNPWQVCRDIANGLGWVLFYDALGVLQGRPSAKAPSFTFLTGVGGALKTRPTRTRTDETVNAVIFTGGIPPGKTTAPVGRAVAPALHPYAPANLARGGVPQYFPLAASSDVVKTQALANQRAEESLDEALLNGVDLAFTAMPFFLEPGDVYRVVDGNLVLDVAYRSGSRTWGLGEASYGAHKLVTASRRSGRF